MINKMTNTMNDTTSGPAWDVHRDGQVDHMHVVYENLKASGQDAPLNISRALAFVLRHSAQKNNLAIRTDGYISLSSVLKTPDFKGISQDMIKAVVYYDTKCRFSLIREEPGSELLVRANQGHTMGTVKDNELLEEILDWDVTVDGEAIHGTFWVHWPFIRTQGLSKAARNHIHLAPGLPEEGRIKGMRSSAEIFIYVDMKKALNDGFKFYRSDNGVVLTPGDEGWLATKYFKRAQTVNLETLEVTELDFEVNERPRWDSELAPQGPDEGTYVVKNIDHLMSKSKKKVAMLKDAEQKQQRGQKLTPDEEAIIGNAFMIEAEMKSLEQRKRQQGRNRIGTTGMTEPAPTHKDRNETPPWVKKQNTDHDQWAALRREKDEQILSLSDQLIGSNMGGSINKKSKGESESFQKAEPSGRKANQAMVVGRGITEDKYTEHSSGRKKIINSKIEAMKRQGEWTTGGKSILTNSTSSNSNLQNLQNPTPNLQNPQFNNRFGRLASDSEMSEESPMANKEVSSVASSWRSVSSRDSDHGKLGIDKIKFGEYQKDSTTPKAGVNGATTKAIGVNNGASGHRSAKSGDAVTDRTPSGATVGSATPSKTFTAVSATPSKTYTAGVNGTGEKENLNGKPSPTRSLNEITPAINLITPDQVVIEDILEEIPKKLPAPKSSLPSRGGKDAAAKQDPEDDGMTSLLARLAGGGYGGASSTTADQKTSSAPGSTSTGASNGLPNPSSPALNISPDIKKSTPTSKVPDVVKRSEVIRAVNASSSASTNARSVNASTSAETSKTTNEKDIKTTPTERNSWNNLEEALAVVTTTTTTSPEATPASGAISGPNNPGFNVLNNNGSSGSFTVANGGVISGFSANSMLNPGPGFNNPVSSKQGFNHAHSHAENNNLKTVLSTGSSVNSQNGGGGILPNGDMISESGNLNGNIKNINMNGNMKNTKTSGKTPIKPGDNPGDYQGNSKGAKGQSNKHWKDESCSNQNWKDDSWKNNGMDDSWKANDKNNEKGRKGRGKSSQNHSQNCGKGSQNQTGDTIPDWKLELQRKAPNTVNTNALPLKNQNNSNQNATQNQNAAFDAQNENSQTAASKNDTQSSVGNINTAVNSALTGDQNQNGARNHTSARECPDWGNYAKKGSSTISDALNQPGEGNPFKAQLQKQLAEQNQCAEVQQQAAVNQQNQDLVNSQNLSGQQQNQQNQVQQNQGEQQQQNQGHCGSVTPICDPETAASAFILSQLNGPQRLLLNAHLQQQAAGGNEVPQKQIQIAALQILQNSGVNNLQIQAVILQAQQVSNQAAQRAQQNAQQGNSVSQQGTSAAQPGNNATSSAGNQLAVGTNVGLQQIAQQVSGLISGRQQQPQLTRDQLALLAQIQLSVASGKQPTPEQYAFLVQLQNSTNQQSQPISQGQQNVNQQVQQLSQQQGASNLNQQGAGTQQLNPLQQQQQHQIAALLLAAQQKSLGSENQRLHAIVQLSAQQGLTGDQIQGLLATTGHLTSDQNVTQIAAALAVNPRQAQAVSNSVGSSLTVANHTNLGNTKNLGNTSNNKKSVNNLGYGYGNNGNNGNANTNQSNNWTGGIGSWQGYNMNYNYANWYGQNNGNNNWTGENNAGNNGGQNWNAAGGQNWNSGQNWNAGGGQNWNSGQNWNAGGGQNMNQNLNWSGQNENQNGNNTGSYENPYNPVWPNLNSSTMDDLFYLIDLNQEESTPTIIRVVDAHELLHKAGCSEYGSLIHGYQPPGGALKQTGIRKDNSWWALGTVCGRNPGNPNFTFDIKPANQSLLRVLELASNEAAIIGAMKAGKTFGIEGITPNIITGDKVKTMLAALFGMNPKEFQNHINRCLQKADENFVKPLIENLDTGTVLNNTTKKKNSAPKDTELNRAFEDLGKLRRGA